ncbi:MAG: C39 family peptidase [Clostridia bacterium]|nr:C39 family peptidase [Clostridia bacterium]
MKKHISTIILIIICAVCATVFYVSATNGSKKNENEDADQTQTSTESTSEVESEASSSFEEEKKLVLDQKGTLVGERLSSSNLRLEWNALRYEGESITYFSAELYFDSENVKLKEHKGVLSINGDNVEFSTTSASPTYLPICTYTKAFEGSGDIDFSVECTFSVPISESNGVNLNSLTLNAHATISDKYSKISDSVLLDVKHISQYPSLPSGDEITSLAIVLNYLKYNVDAEELCDLYLDKGPVGFTNFYKANVGNPRDTYNSYGCLAPVIKSSADKYINANGGTSKAYDISGCDVNELYYQVSCKNPVIVWACDDFEITPSVSRIWVVDGESLYYKSNMACMVLIGYDNTKNTVTLSNPAGGVFSVDKDLFELRFAQMGSYAVTVH